MHYDAIIVSQMTDDHEYTMSSKLGRWLVTTEKPCDDSHTINQILNKVLHSAHRSLYPKIGTKLFFESFLVFFPT
jgi:hypothetical protein